MHTMVSKLWRKLGEDAANPTYIFTEPRVGFRMPKGRRRARSRPQRHERDTMTMELMPHSTVRSSCV